MAVLVLLPSDTPTGPKFMFLVALFAPLVLLLFDRLVFLVSRRIIVMRVFTAGAWFRVTVKVKGDPDMASMVCWASWLTVFAQSSIITSTPVAGKSVIVYPFCDRAEVAVIVTDILYHKAPFV